VLPETTGVEAKLPVTVGVPVKRKRQRGTSVPTFPESIPDPSAARVPARSAFGRDQSPVRLSDPHPAATRASTAARAKALRRRDTGLVR
jgi:hypothetical protein